MAPKVDQALALLREASETYSPAVLASSLGAEDMVLLDLIASAALEIGVFTLDTGRLPPETHDLLQLAKSRYRSVPIDIFVPEASDVEAYVGAHGPNGFYESVALRQECCHLRKVKPLARALAGKRAWITGLRRAQSAGRSAVAFQELDRERGIQKFNPLADWSDDEVWGYIRAHDVPVSALHGQGYPSIGCAPCTRAVAPGEDSRAGRWWWENPEFNECGLHPRQQAQKQTAHG